MRSVAGIILAGGLSRRMFPTAASGTGAVPPSGDKGLLALGETTMIGHVIERLAPQVDTLALNANGDPARFAALGLPVVADTIAGFVGPLAGVLAGMRWARTQVPGARWIASVSADAPFLPRDLVARLVEALRGRGNAIAIAQSAGELHPVIGLWPVALADDLETALRGGLRKVLAWTDRHGTVPVPFAMIAAAMRETGPQAIDPFFNANTPEELAEARRLLALLDERRPI